MNYEFQDYREQKPLKDPGPWLTWFIPEQFIFRYFFRMILFLYFIPTMLFGVQLSSLGYFVQFLVIDYVTWLQYKNTNFF